MITIYKSEKTGKTYTSEEECIKAEKEFDKVKQAELVKAKEISKRKKELSDKINEANEKVDIAYKDYHSTQEKANAMIEAAKKSAEELLLAAARELEKATEERMNQIIEFNKEFGPYTTSYVGDKARAEYEKVVNEMRKIFNWKFWF